MGSRDTGIVPGIPNMATMNAKYIARKQGGPLVATTTPRPTTIEPTEVMIRLRAVAINPADIKMIDQGLRISTWPLVAGGDGAGVVEAVGDKVTSVGVGDGVLAKFTPGDRGGSFQQFAVIQETMVAKKPASWSFEDAATLPVCYTTGVIALGIGLKTSLPFIQDGPTTNFKPSSVLILGGSSAVGTAVIQLLRLALPDCTILATSSPKNHAHIATLGINKAIDRNSSTLITDVKSATPGSHGVEAIIDAVGAGSTERHIFETLDPNGPKRYAQVWTGAEEIDVPNEVDSILFRNSDLSRLQGGRDIMGSLQRLLEEDIYKLPLPVRRVGDGIDGLERGLMAMKRGVSGEKLVVGL